jgi:hypothetical protein
MTKDDSNMAANAICHAATLAQESWQQASYEVCRPCVLFKPKLSKDGDQWCALFGDNLQEGVSGFGKTPADAMYDFDRNWSKP